MPKLILRCNYLKNAPPSHLENYINYISTREGVEKVGDTTGLLPAMAKQKEIIEDILSKINDASRMHEYYDYIRNPTRENASEFITQALENNLDIVAKKKNYIDYLANRPGAERIGSHGLFSNEGESIVLSKVAGEVADHPGVIWTNVISLRREDAERLGYDSAAQWQALIRSRVQLLAENYKIDSRNLKWYAAFHNESHHPHVHLVVYSEDPSEGYLTRQGIEAMRSAFAHDIFRQDFMSIYERKTEQRNQLKEQAEMSLFFYLEQMQSGICHNPKIAEDMQLLSDRLKNTGGKKVYGYLKADVKAIVNRIVDELAEDTRVAECYRKWQECQNEIVHHYKDSDMEPVRLSEQKEFKSIKNMVIREAVRFGEGHVYVEDTDVQRQGDAAAESEEKFWQEETGMAEIIWSQGSEPESVPTRDDCIPVQHENYYAGWTDTYREARMYLYGTGETAPDEEAAYEIMKEEAERGNAFAIYDMGRIYERGIFVEADQEAAQGWYAKALYVMKELEQQKADACLEYRIGSMYMHGIGTEADEKQTEHFYRKAADCGSIHAKYQLAKLYFRQEPPDEGMIKQAATWLEECAAKGNQFAAYMLGKLYLIGKDVPQDRGKAYAYFVQSAEQGNIYAAYFLEHWNDMPHPDLLLMATRLMHQLGNVIEDDIAGRRGGSGRGGIDRKLQRKLKQKKTSQGHAEGDHEENMQTQEMHM